MDLKERISSFSLTGDIIRNALEGGKGKYETLLSELIHNQYINNPWFTPGNVRLSLFSAASMLEPGKLAKWISAYPGLNEERDPVDVGVIMAGNIPLVGFHDFLCVLMTGNNIIARTSSKDRDLIRVIAEILCSVNSGFKGRIKFTDSQLKGFNAVIATGSDNSARYFEYYFAKYPSIIRKNRNSVAILTGDESAGEIKELATDFFSFFGLGCRNISKIFIPAGTEPDEITQGWDHYSGIMDHSKYANNYDYNKAVFLVNRIPFRDAGFMLLRESPDFSSPVSVLNYEFYDSAETVYGILGKNRDKIQCIIGQDHVPFGTSQMPELWDYPDNIDIIDFLLKKNHGRVY